MSTAPWDVKPSWWRRQEEWEWTGRVTVLLAVLMLVLVVWAASWVLPNGEQTAMASVPPTPAKVRIIELMSRRELEGKWNCTNFQQCIVMVPRDYRAFFWSRETIAFVEETPTADGKNVVFTLQTPDGRLYQVKGDDDGVPVKKARLPNGKLVTVRFPHLLTKDKKGIVIAEERFGYGFGLSEHRLRLATGRRTDVGIRMGQSFAR